VVRLSKVRELIKVNSCHPTFECPLLGRARPSTEQCISLILARDPSPRLAGTTRQRVAELFQQYKAQLNELKLLRCLWQFQQVSKNTPDQRMAYLKKAITNYGLFLRQAIAEANREITGKAPSPVR
jgi:hypothetical protein